MQVFGSAENILLCSSPAVYTSDVDDGKSSDEDSIEFPAGSVDKELHGKGVSVLFFHLQKFNR